MKNPITWLDDELRLQAAKVKRTYEQKGEEEKYLDLIFGFNFLFPFSKYRKVVNLEDETEIGSSLKFLFYGAPKFILAYNNPNDLGRLIGMCAHIYDSIHTFVYDSLEKEKEEGIKDYLAERMFNQSYWRVLATVYVPGDFLYNIYNTIIGDANTSDLLISSAFTSLLLTTVVSQYLKVADKDRLNDRERREGKKLEKRLAPTTIQE